MDALRHRLGAASESYAEIPIATLEDLMGYLENPYMVKLDCKGCEREILRGSLESLKNPSDLSGSSCGDYRGW